MGDFLTLPGPLHVIAGAVDSCLRDAFDPRQFTHDFIAPRLTAKEWARVTRVTPFVGLGWSGIKPDTDQGRVFKADAEFFVVLANRNPRSARDRFLGDAHGTGLFGMLHVATEALQALQTARSAGGAWETEGTIQVVQVSPDIDEAFLDDEMAVAQLMLRVRYVADYIPELDPVIGQFATADTTYDLAAASGTATVEDAIPIPQSEAA